MEKIGQKLIALRKFLNLSQKDLASKIPGGTDYTYIGKIERKDQRPSLKILEKIASVTGVDMGYFFSDKTVTESLRTGKGDDLNSQVVRKMELLRDEDKRFLIEIIEVLRKYNKIRNATSYKSSAGARALKAAERGRAYRAGRKK